MNDRRLRLLGIPALAILISLLTLDDLPLRFSWGLVVLHLSISLLFTATLWVGTLSIWGWLLRRYPAVGQTQRRLWLLAGASLLYTAVATTALMALLHQLLPPYFSLAPRPLLTQILFNLIPGAGVLLLYESLHFFGQWELNVRRAEQLSRAGVQSQLEALQNQLDPHFLFNSLNTLSALIDDDNAPAQNFVEQLADVYRYVLLARDKATVPLREELAFVDTYVALQQTRFRTNLRVSRQIPPVLLDHRVAPLSVQLLVENALKHNVVSREHPLEISIAADAGTGYLRVQNARRPRAAGLGPGTGLGLQNTVHRYELLQAPHPVRIEPTPATFTVRLPLLPPH
ncbi:Histidine kinase [Hymenobacter daecheongensis DSM 21074]|uniref:Histidine kinase n=1 Tax=Hymenobacter daecheongensis DSM 21074 TaxID=1121955 RepID=A0A1M6KRT2_9BACT|nr:sensor histidine kinase [Hymenobacter daecheongensis]SHJ61665.1 Histidine kinase [Hymenobacter daecheongensis DSM 21074]